jgi:hypothetical protein
MMASPGLVRVILPAILPGLSGFLSGVLSFALNVAIYGTCTALQLGPLDILVQKLERTRLLRRIFTASHTRRFKRYLAPGFRPASTK